MLFLHSMLVFVISGDTLGFIVRGPSGPLVVPLGGSVILPCYVETPLVSEVKVVWSRADSEVLVHLYQDGESRAEAQHKDYRDRARFFTDQIQHGNFSLRLDNVAAQDKGVFRCKVYSQQLADRTVVEIKRVDIFLAPRSRRSISASVGEDVTLNCSVESHITPEHIEEVSWKKTGEDEDILVLLVQSNETSPDSAHERYRDRAEFFTAEISKGNFSIRLTSVRTEDKGVYMCQVFAGGLSANVTVVLEILGFSWLHWVLLILCIIACGFALLFCLNTYSRRENDQRSLQVGLLLSPFITMLLASFIWQVIEGSLYETVSCSTLYILGPLRLFRVTPLAPDKKLLRYFMTAHADHAAFMAVMLSVFLVENWENISKVLIAGAFGLLVLMCLVFITRFFTKLAKEEVLSCSGGLCDRCRRMYGKVQLIVATCSFSWLPSLQLALLLYIHYASDKVFIITALPVLHWLAHLYCTKNSTLQFCLLCLHKVIWLLMIAMSVAMLRFYIMLLRNEHDDAGLVCVAGFVQALWVLAFSEVPVHYQKLRLRTFIFLYGSAGLVLVNSAALMTDLITKAVGGVRLVGDLRVIAFPSEWLFTLALMISALAAPRNNESINASPSADFNGTPGKQAPIDMDRTSEMENLETRREEEIC